MYREAGFAVVLKNTMKRRSLSLFLNRGGASFAYVLTSMTKKVDHHKKGCSDKNDLAYGKKM